MRRGANPEGGLGEVGDTISVWVHCPFKPAEAFFCRSVRAEERFKYENVCTKFLLPFREYVEKKLGMFKSATHLFPAKK